MPSACVLLANGFEEIEAVTVIDVLRRADVTVLAVGVQGAEVTGSRNVVVRTDISLQQAEARDWDLVVVPGGRVGAEFLQKDPHVQALLTAQYRANKKLAAICAGPIALGQAGVLINKRATCYPGFEAQLKGAKHVNEDVVVDGGITTSRGPATAMKFALELVRQLQSPESAAKVAKATLAQA